MSTIGLYDPNLPSQIDFNLGRSGQEGKIAESLGNNMSKLEGQLMEKYTALSGAKTEEDRQSLESEISKLDLQYKRANRAFEAFMQLMKNMHETLMRSIQNLSVR